MDTHYDAVIITTHNSYLLAMGHINSTDFLLTQKHSLGSDFVAHSEPFGVIGTRWLNRRHRGSSYISYHQLTDREKRREKREGIHGQSN